MMYCIGCGIDIASKPRDRRALTTSESEHIVTVWKAILHSLENEDQQAVDNIDIIVSGGDSHRVPKMCRKCFYGYERYIKFHDTIQENLRKAAVALELFPSSSLAQPLPKIPRLDSSLSWRVTRDQSSQHVDEDQPSQSESSSTTQSPEVAVGLLLILYVHIVCILKIGRCLIYS